ncbi:hypothetical protein VL20_6301 [Microcystis panniformis FACHB-1757]|uniref:Uncharacterized protein n=1 Tax=Microcystis panniformis FACHB-1757 TaxID=1638788 RepID=A0A0K1SAB6_9CHRO|nr:hypothetical protein VL20_6301 [Microcystis panniformis FACHB-1757]
MIIIFSYYCHRIHEKITDNFNPLDSDGVSWGYGSISPLQ